MRGPKLLSVVRFLDRPHPPTPGGCFQLFKEKRGGGCPRRMRAFLTTCGQTDSGHTSWGSVRTPSPGLSWQQNPAVLALNSSFLVHTFGASLVAQVSSGDTFARAHIHSACGHRAHLDTGLQHAWPPLQALGVPPNNHIRVSVGGEPSLSTITAGFSPKIPPPSAMIPEHRKGVFIVSLKLTALLSKRFQRSSFKKFLSCLPGRRG